MTNEEIITQVIADEGGDAFTCRPDDPGGATRYGITIPALSDWWKAAGRTGTINAGTIEALDEGTARGYYRWLMDHSGIGRITNDTLRYFVFDAAVNVGPERAVRLLQHALGITEDGIIGPATLASTPYLDASKLCRLFGIAQMEFYGSVRPPEVLVANIRGWLARLGRKLRMVA